jgi:hypothetical protein
MPASVKNQILAVEERLRLAMLASNTGALDELIAPSLIFTNHLGQIVSKQGDLALHRSKVLKFHTLEPSERLIDASEELAVVSVRMKVSGVYADAPFEADFRYTRIWRQSADGAWRVVAGHMSAVQV